MQPGMKTCAHLSDGVNLRVASLPHPEHPLRNEALSLRETYATGVAFLLTRVAEHLSKGGRTYLWDLVESLRLGDNQVGRILSFASDADAGIVEEIAATFVTQRHKYLFVIELYQATRVNGRGLRPAEKRMIEIFAELLGLKPFEAAFLKRFASGLPSGNPKKLQSALSDSFLVCLEPPLDIFQYFCGPILAPEATARSSEWHNTASMLGYAAAST